MNNKLFFTGIILSLLIISSCGKRGGKTVIPPSNLPVEEQEKIRSVLRDTSYMEKADRILFAKQYGKEGVPFMIERIMEIYKMGSDWKYPRLYLIADNLILSLGDIGDNRALPALKLWLTDTKYRVFRGIAAYALGKLRNPEAIEPLWKVWEEEKEYLKKGDDEGPWPFAGHHPSGCYVHGVLEKVGQALFELNEKKIVGELIEVAKLSYGQWSSGYMKILWTLTKVTGQPLSESTSQIQYWERWWEENKIRYQ